VAFTNLPIKQAIQQNTPNGMIQVTDEGDQQQVWVQPQNKSLLESRKTQRQNVSFYFSNND
jgi:hypothetical protein